jgi:hypothetical protein
MAFEVLKERQGSAWSPKRAVMLVATALACGLGPGAARAVASVAYFEPLPATGGTELQTPRYDEVAAPLPDGKVLIAGGYADSAILRSAELFDPISDTFTALPATGDTELTVPRARAVAASLPSGQVLIAGGTVSNNSTVVTQSAELFDPATDTFHALPATGNTELQTPRSGAVAAPLPDGKVLIAGGTTGTRQLDTAELFDSTNDTFTALPENGASNLQSARAEATAASLPDGDVLIAGGIFDNTRVKTAELFDPVTNTFTALTSTMVLARSSVPSAPLPNGQVLIAGGDDGTGANNSVELFNPVTQRFCIFPVCGAATLNTPRGYETATPLPDGTILIAGGFDGAHALASAELYVSAPEARATGGDFGDQTVGQRSAEQPLTITNIGAQALVFSGTFTVSQAAADYTITDNTCSGRRLAFEQSCTIEVRFTPSTTGERSAVIGLPDNEPGAAHGIPLAGTGIAANSGPTGPPGPTGQTGAPGAAGPAGSPGQIELVICRIIRVKRHGRTHALKRRKCTVKHVTGSATFTATEARATLRRGRIVYAIGTAMLSRLTLRQRRPITPGGYTLSLIRGTGPDAFRTSQALTINQI